MKGVSELYDRHAGSDIYVVGTGASMRVFPRSYFEGRITIGLNMAWRQVPVTYGITIHPDLNIPEFLVGATPHPEIIWVAGRRKCEGLLTAEQLQYACSNFFGFEYDGQRNTQPPHEPSDAGRVISWLERPHGNQLYVWSSIAQTGVNLAANMGAKNVIVVGCDNCALSGNHHAHIQHTRWKGVVPEHRYQQYEEGLSEVRSVMRRRGVNVVSLTPFVSLRDPDGDFGRMCAEVMAPLRLAGEDVAAMVPTDIPSRWKRLAHRIRRLAGLPTTEHLNPSVQGGQAK